MLSPAPGARMVLRKFVAPTMAQCLLRMRSELGTSAVILSARTVQLKRWLGLFHSDHVEVTAGRGLRTMPRRSTVARSLDRIEARAPQTDSPSRSSAGFPARELLSTPAAVGAAYRGVTQEIADLKTVIGELATQWRDSQTPEIPRPFLASYQALADQQVNPALAREIVFAAASHGSDATDVRALVCAQIEKRLKTCGPLARAAAGRPHVVALVGPTGVGKTTTIAKLAANLKLREGRKIGLITIDTYRIAAIDQLRKYAEIIDAPLCVVSNPAEIRQAVARMAELDFILIDTAGRSPKDAVKLEELGVFLAAASPDEVHLVISSVCGSASARLALERFGGVRADRLIFTKLDEAARLGELLNVAARTQLPVSYLTHGQDVPNDIEVASAARLARMMTEPSQAATRP